MSIRNYIIGFLFLLLTGCNSVNSNLQPMCDSYPVTIFQESDSMPEIRLAVTIVDPHTDEVILASANVTINETTHLLTQTETVYITADALTLHITKPGFHPFSKQFSETELINFQSRVLIIRLMPESSLGNSLIVR